MLKVIELFAGIGAQASALERLKKDFNFDYEIVAISEIDKYASESYELIHGKVNNLGDITKIERLPKADFWTYSSPCQDISQAGKQRGFEKGSGTRSGLLWEVDRLLQVAKEHNELPKYLLMENVKALVSDKFYDGFLGWLDILKSYGYKSFWKVLNAKDYGVPQNRERVFVVSILDKDAYYEFPKSFKLEKRIKDILEQEVDEKYYLSQKMIDGMKRSNFHTYQLDNLLLNDKDYAKTVTARFEGASQCIQVGQTNGAYERANRTYSVDGISPTITTAKSQLFNIKVTIKDFIKENNKNAKHQQDLLQSEDDICRTIPAGTHASTPHLLKTVVKEEPIGTYDYQKSDKFYEGKK